MNNNIVHFNKLFVLVLVIASGLFYLNGEMGYGKASLVLLASDKNLTCIHAMVEASNHRVKLLQCQNGGTCVPNLVEINKTHQQEDPGCICQEGFFNLDCSGITPHEDDNNLKLNQRILVSDINGNTCNEAEAQESNGIRKLLKCDQDRQCVQKFIHKNKTHVLEEVKCERHYDLDINNLKEQLSSENLKLTLIIILTIIIVMMTCILAILIFWNRPLSVVHSHRQSLTNTVDDEKPPAQGQNGYRLIDEIDDCKRTC